MKYKLLLLDLDDTLCDSERAYRYALEQCYKYFLRISRVRITRKQFDSYYAKAKTIVHKDLGNVASSHNRLLYFQKLFELLEMPADPVKLDKITNIYWKTTYKKLKLFPGVDSALIKLRQKGSKICILSDLLAEVQMRKAEALGLRKYFDFFVTSEEVGVEKPDRKMFEFALKKAGFRVAEAIMLGNGCRRDIFGAKRLGITAVIFGKEICQEADYRIRNFSEIVNIFSEVEGVIKYNYKWQKTRPVPIRQIRELNQYRQKFHKMKLIASYPDGLGYGNISKRLIGNSFLITGTQTGPLARLTAKHYTVVKKCDFNKNFLYCMGPIAASSESLSHAAIYKIHKSISAVIHVHNNKFWAKAIGKLPTTNKKVAYGTIAMTQEIQKLFRANKLSNKGVFVMGGHKDGIVAFGKDLKEASAILLKNYNLYK